MARSPPCKTVPTDPTASTSTGPPASQPWATPHRTTGSTSSYDHQHQRHHQANTDRQATRLRRHRGRDLDGCDRHLQRAGHSVVDHHDAPRQQRRDRRARPHTTPHRRATFTPSATLTNIRDLHRNRLGCERCCRQHHGPGQLELHDGCRAPADTTPPTITARTPASGATNVATSTHRTATFSEAVQSSTINMTLSGPGGSVAGNVRLRLGTRKATFTPSAALAASTTYTVDVSGAKDIAGNTMTAVSWTFTTARRQQQRLPLHHLAEYSDPGDRGRSGHRRGGNRSEVPHHAEPDHHRNPLLQGPGEHRDSCRHRCGRGTGTKLATVTFTGETASGWQQATFATPWPSQPIPPTSRPTTHQPVATPSPRTTSPPRPPVAAHRPAERHRRSERGLQIRRQRIPDNAATDQATTGSTSS